MADAVKVADKAIADRDGWATNGRGSLKTQQWGVAAGKTVYESHDKTAKIAVGVAASGQGRNVKDKQFGISFKKDF